ncbi:MAG: type III pantothenate kinase [Phycisphaeraceae bacterium]|nr:type III pantothenate kinase [Phycisphaeraceae bacterium]MCW5762277.1 type III pantothenate kinase [Phycisphaeraceae bacterium]
MEHNDQLLALCVGNTRTRAGLFHNQELAHVVVFPSRDPAEARTALARLLADHRAQPTVVMASVNDPDAATIGQIASEVAGSPHIGRIGRDVPIPLQYELDDGSTVGQDRWLNALAAYNRTKQACVVIDIGTAITIDFIDGAGVFRGGVIAPGLNMMLDALHRGTAALPAIAFTMPEIERGTLGRDTAHAMQLGVLAAARGLVRVQLEACAEVYGAYPQVIATGGDMAVLEADGFVEHFVPDLQLLGVSACVAALAADAES